jgi:hypothetical protein
MTTARKRFTSSTNISTTAFNFEDETLFFESSAWRDQPDSLGLFHSSLQL